MMRTAAAPDIAPYDGWADHYDSLLGKVGFDHLWPAFTAAYRRNRMQVGVAVDFGCGTGMFLAALARFLPDAELFGVDRSVGMLRQAAARLSEHRVKLLRGDLRSVEVPRKADLVTCNFSTINYLCREMDLRNAILNFARHLTDRGFLILDLLCGGNGGSGVDFTQTIIEPGMRASWRIRSPGGNTKGSVIMHNCRREAHQWRCWREEHRQRWWSLRDLRSRFSEVGLSPVTVVPLGEVPPERGGRWVQIVARRE